MKTKYKINSISFDTEKDGDIKVDVDFDTKNFKSILASVHLSRFDNTYEVDYLVRNNKLHTYGSVYKIKTTNMYESILSAIDQIIGKDNDKLINAFGLNMNYHKFVQSIRFEKKIEYVIDKDLNPSELSCILHAERGNYGYCFWVKAKMGLVRHSDGKCAVDVELTNQSNAKFLGKQIMMTRDQFGNTATCLKILKSCITKPLYYEMCIRDIKKKHQVKVGKYKLYWENK